MKKSILFSALLLCGLASAASIENKLQKMVSGLAQVEQTAASCTTAIERYKKGPSDYKTIATQETEFVDPEFTMSNAMQWAGFTYNQLYYFSSSPWMRTKSAYPSTTLFGSSDNSNDIKQGSLGDCYYLAGIHALSELDANF